MIAFGPFFRSVGSVGWVDVRGEQAWYPWVKGVTRWYLLSVVHRRTTVLRALDPFASPSQGLRCRRRCRCVFYALFQRELPVHLRQRLRGLVKVMSMITCRGHFVDFGQDPEAVDQPQTKRYDQPLDQRLLAGDLLWCSLLPLFETNLCFHHPLCLSSQHVSELPL